MIDRVVDIVEEGYDLAIRIARHGMPQHQADLRLHQCIGYSYASMADEWQVLDSAGRPHHVKVRYAMQTNIDLLAAQFDWYTPWERSS